jgi:hypothetical protein
MKVSPVVKRRDTSLLLTTRRAATLPGIRVQGRGRSPEAQGAWMIVSRVGSSRWFPGEFLKWWVWPVATSAVAESLNWQSA